MATCHPSLQLMAPSEHPQSERSSVFVSEPRATTSGLQGQQASLTERVINTIARAIGNDPIDMGPLYETIDPDLLTRFVERDSPEPDSSTTDLIRFHFEGCVVTVYANGRIVVVAPKTV